MQALAPFAIGVTVFLCHLVALPVDGCSVNPARSFGTSAVAGNWDDQWIFWVGPIGGGIIAAVVYETLLRDQSQSKVSLRIYGRVAVQSISKTDFVLVYIEMKCVSTGPLLFLECSWMVGSSDQP